MIRKLKHALPLSLIVAFSLPQASNELSVLRAETKPNSSTKKAEPKTLPWYASPLEHGEPAIQRTANEVAPSEGASTRKIQPAILQNSAARKFVPSQHSGKTTGAQKIPAAVTPSGRSTVRQVAGPAGQSQSQQYQSSPSQFQSQGQDSSEIQKQLDAMYREKGLEAPRMNYDSLPVQGPEDYQEMQKGQQQISAAPQNQSAPGGNQRAYGQQPENQASPSWIQRIFGRRSKSQETQQPQTPGTYRNPQGMNQNEEANQNPRSQGGQYPAGNRQQQISQSQSQETEQNDVEYPGATQPQQNTAQPVQNSRNVQPAEQPPATNGLDYSRLRQSRQTPQSQATNPRRKVVPQEVEEPEESLDIQDATPRLENRIQEPDETPATPNREPALTRQPSPFENLELHTPEEPQSAQHAESAQQNTPAQQFSQPVQQPSGSNAPVASARQPGANPAIIPGNDLSAQDVRPIIETDDAELDAKYRILAAFPELDGMKGFCPVALRNDRELIRAKRLYSATHKDKQYQFSSSEAVIKFHQDPEKYLPLADGNDIVEMEAGNAQIGTLDFAAWYHGRLYLFANLDNLEAFVKHPGQYEQLVLGGSTDGNQAEAEEPEESMEFEDAPTAPEEQAEEESSSAQPREQTAPANQSPADALRGAPRPPAPVSSEEKINVPPPPPERDDDEDEVDMPGNQRPTAKLSQVTKPKWTSRKMAHR